MSSFESPRLWAFVNATTQLRCTKKVLQIVEGARYCSTHKHHEANVAIRKAGRAVTTHVYEVEQYHKVVEAKRQAVATVVPLRATNKRLRDESDELEAELYGTPVQRPRLEREEPAPVACPDEPTWSWSPKAVSATDEEFAKKVHAALNATPAPVFEAPRVTEPCDTRDLFREPTPAHKSVESKSSSSAFATAVPLALAAAQIASSFMFSRPAPIVPGLLSLPGSAPIRLAPFIAPALGALGALFS